MELIHENIGNLTSLWRAVGQEADAYTSGTDFDLIAINYSKWPNRLWFHHDINEENLRAAKSQLLSAPAELVIPYWDIYQSRSYELLEANGFERLFEQVGMSLRLAQTYEVSDTLYLEKITGKKDALLWEDLFSKAFGYKISHNLLLPNYPGIDFLIAFHQDQPVGTVILHNPADKVVGIHAMGIVPDRRRKGLADLIMKIILNQSIGQGYEYATLQASDMGKGLYLKLGFQEQFTMKNYALAG